MKLFLALLLAGSCSLVCAQTNAPATNPPPQQIEITSDAGHWDGKTFQMIYVGHVFVTDNVKAKLYCGQLTVDVPSDGSHLTNIVAETNVVIDYLDTRGQTNTITADRAVYSYRVATNATMTATNERVTFTGGQPMPKVVNPQATMLGEPLYYDFGTRQFGGSHYQTFFNLKPSNGTNTSPLNLLK